MMEGARELGGLCGRVGVQVASLSAHQKFGGGRGLMVGLGRPISAGVGRLLQGWHFPRWRIGDIPKRLSLCRKYYYCTADDFPHKSLIFYLNMACTSSICYGDILPIGLLLSILRFLVYSFLILFRPTFSSACAFQHPLV
jgi:hypothetical protein